MDLLEFVELKEGLGLELRLLNFQSNGLLHTVASWEAVCI